MFGLLNINKPIGITSRRVVDRVARIVKPAKAGHAGTLDPLASGVLVVCIGPATRLVPYVQAMRKEYRGSFLLGCSSPTEDVEGPVTELVDPPHPTLDELRQAAISLTGTIEQRPPSFSAVKVAGRRAYALARAGELPDLEPRPVTVYRLDVQRYEYPELELSIACSGGTYVRTLGRQLAESVGTDAVMSALVRTAVGDFSLPKAVSPDGLTRENLPDLLIDPITAVADLPRITVGLPELEELSHGRPIHAHGIVDAAEYAAVDGAGKLIAILTRGEADTLRPLRNFRL